jgi:hypothetical protein
MTSLGEDLDGVRESVKLVAFQALVRLFNKEVDI